jgi:hypothetical protein
MGNRPCTSLDSCHTALGRERFWNTSMELKRQAAERKDDSDRCHRHSKAFYSGRSGMAHLLNLSGPNAYPLTPPDDERRRIWHSVRPEFAHQPTEANAHGEKIGSWKKERTLAHNQHTTGDMGLHTDRSTITEKGPAGVGYRPRPHSLS